MDKKLNLISKTAFYLLVFLSFTVKLTAGEITLSGEVNDSNFKSNYLRIKVHGDYFKVSAYYDANVIKVPIVDGKFSISIPSNFNYGYIQFADPYFNSTIYNAMFLTPGKTHVEVEVKDQNLFFVGNTLNLFECQKELYEATIVVNRRFADKGKEFYKWIIGRRAELYKQTDAILARVQDAIPAVERRLVRVNICSRVDLALVSLFSRGDFQKNPALLQYASDLLATNYVKPLDEIPDFIVQNSFSYSQYLYQLAYTKALIAEQFKNQETDVFSATYNDIKNTYHGIARDKAITICFLELLQRNAHSIEFIKDALSFVQDDYCRSKLLLFDSFSVPGNKAVPFELQDNQGKTMSLDDFKGKIVVLDFWFFGCTGCLQLAKHLKPIILRYSDNPNIEFISINVDENKERWLKGLESGKYSSDLQINLYTNGLGVTHPMIQKYQFKGYPQLVLIDKEGEIISVNPPRPISDKNKKDFCKLVNSYL